MSLVNFPTREFLKRSLLIAVGAAVSPVALAQRKTPTPGAEYRLITPPQSVDTAGKIEVLEFFWYACPHCAAIEPVFKEWAKQLPADVLFRKAHVPFNEIKHQQLFYTLEAMAKTEEYGDKIFTAIHEDKNRMDSLDKITAVLTKAGIDKKAFTDTWESFSVQTRMRKASSMAATYKIESVPSVVVNGTYLTSPSSAGGNQAILQVIDHLIAQERIKAKK
jgi:protein dithiol oxidoreductase (disulfide-forming)